MGINLFQKFRALTGRKYYLLVSLHMGLMSSIAQVLLVRETLTISRGNEFIIGFIFASWFCGIFAGAKLNPAASADVLEKRLHRSLILMPLILLPVIALIHLVPVLIPRTPGTFYSGAFEILFSFIFTAPVSFFVGYFFPPAVSLMMEDLGARAGGFVYTAESMGAFFGALLFSFLLVDTVNPMGTASILCAVSALLYLLGKGPRKISVTVLLSVTVVFMLFSGFIEREMQRAVWNRSHSGVFLSLVNTRYQAVVIESSGEQISVYGDGVLYYSLPDGYENRLFFHLIQSLRKTRSDRIVMFGTGPGSIPWNIGKSGVAEAFYLEIDPLLLSTMKQHADRIYPQSVNGMNVSFIAQDMRRFLYLQEKPFDMIISCPPMPHNAMINRFYTVEFYRLCRSRLTDNGIFITSLSGFGSYMENRQKAFLASVYKSFSSVFPYNLCTSGDRIYLIGATKKGVIPEDPAELISRYRNMLKVHPLSGLEPAISSNFTPDELKSIFEKTHIVYFSKSMKRMLPMASENLDTRPVAYWRQMQFSSYMEGTVMYHLFRGYYWLIALLAFITAAVLRSIKKHDGTLQCMGGAVIGIVGFISMSLVIMMIMLYQNFYGMLYYRIALINGLFMLGLGTGSWIVNRLKRIPRASIILLLSATLAMVFLFIQVKWELLFWSLLFLFSLIAGSMFPALYRMFPAMNSQKTASNLDSMDFLGSIGGAIIATMLIPISGINYVAAACIVLSIAAFCIMRKMEKRNTQN